MGKQGKGKNVEVIYLSGPVDDEFVKEARRKLLKATERSPGCSLVIDFNSPGGSIFAGLDLFGVLRQASKDGHHVTTIASGFCASMGGVLLQAGDVRQIREDSYLHLHEALSGGSGNASELEDVAQLLNRLTRQMAEIYARRSKYTADEIHERIKRQEWWLTAAEALEAGFVDEVI